MAKVISITNQKGGVGKTTTATNLGAGLSILGKKVLVMDLDPQANTTLGFGIEKGDVGQDMYDVIIKDVKLKSIIKKIKNKDFSIDVAPASVQLAGVDIHLHESGKQDKQPIKEAIQTIKKDYDYIIIDCPPSLGMLNRNALIASDSVIIPIQSEYYALEGMSQLFATIRIIKKMLNNKLKIEGILLTMYSSNNNLAKEVKQEIKKLFKEKVYHTEIPRNVKLAEAPQYAQTIFEYDKASKGAKAYMKLTQEVINNG